MGELTYRQKWIDEGGVYFPIPYNTVIHETPGPGVFKACMPDPRNRRIGLQKLCDKFEFDHKIYKVGAENLIERVKKAWNSDYYKDNNKNLGIILNGYKGTGKTVASKLLCNEIEIPVIIVDDSFDGAILDFIREISFDCIVFLDEAEKTFSDESDSYTLLKLIDGAYSSDSRRLFVLTTNSLRVNENLIGRPGRIRYIQEFKSLPIDTIREYLEDNLEDKSKMSEVIEVVSTLDMVTIDILRAIVEEVAVFGSLSDSKCLNIPRSPYNFDVLELRGCKWENKDKIMGQLKEIIGNENFNTWIHKNCVENEVSYYDEVKAFEGALEGCTGTCLSNLSTSCSILFEGSDTNMGEIIRATDDKEAYKLLWIRDYCYNESMYLVVSNITENTNNVLNLVF